MDRCTQANKEVIEMARRTRKSRKKNSLTVRVHSGGIISITRGNLHYTITPNDVSIYSTRTKKLERAKISRKYYNFFVQQYHLYKQTKKKHYLTDICRDIKILISRDKEKRRKISKKEKEVM